MDTSLPCDRLRFCSLIDGGISGSSLPGAATAIAQCEERMPETTAALLGLHPPATYAQGAAVIRHRWSDGRASH